MDLENIKRNYEGLDDEKLIKLATIEINSLRKDVIPILEAELIKRNISISDEKEKIAGENNHKETAPKEEKGLMDQMNEFMVSFEIPHILKSVKKYYANSTILFLNAFIFSLIIFFLFQVFFWAGLRLILLFIISTVLLTMVLKKIRAGKIAEIQPDKVIISKYPKLNFGIFRIFVLIQIVFNLLEKIEIRNKDLSKIYKKNDFTDKGFYIDKVDGASKEKKSHRVFLEALSENDRKQIIEVIKLKIEELK